MTAGVPTRATASHSSSSVAARANGAVGKAAVGEERLLARPLLRGVQRHAGRPHRRQRFDGVDRFDRHVLELERHDVHLAGERAQRIEVLVRRRDLDVGHLAGRRVFVRRERVDAVAHAPRGDGEHAPELAAAEHAERRARAR